MHYSLGGAALGHTSVGHVLSVRGSGRMCPGSSSSRSRFALTGILEPQGAVPQALTLLGGARFIAWRLRPPFLGECRRGPRHFWECRAYLGYCPAPGPTKKWLCAILVQLVGRKTNTDNLQAAWQYQNGISNCYIIPVFCIFVLLLLYICFHPLLLSACLHFDP